MSDRNASVEQGHVQEKETLSGARRELVDWSRGPRSRQVGVTNAGI